MSNDWNQALILLVVGMGFGVYLTYRLMAGRQGRQEKRLASDYYKGLNFLLNEQPDKALDVFIRLMSVDNETLETHYALGSLFRRRGEIDRAIRIHQNLIARPSLDQEQRQHALFELSQDYAKAGLFDRAERLLHEIVEVPGLSGQVLNQLATIYEQQSDWEQAIEIRQRLVSRGAGDQESIIAHYHCELAEAALREKDRSRAREHLKNVKHGRRSNVRSLLIYAELAVADQEPKIAMRYYRQALEREPRIIVLALPKLQHFLGQLEPEGRLWRDWQGFTEGCKPLHSHLAQAALLHKAFDAHWVYPFLRHFLEQQAPLVELVQSLTAQSSLKLESPETVRQAARVLSEFVKHRPSFLCEQCGYASQVFYWQCPSCKSWDTTHTAEMLYGGELDLQAPSSSPSSSRAA